MSPPAGRVVDTVLVVDEEVLVRSSIAEYLRHCGYRVIEAASGEEAMIVLQNSPIHVDVLLTGIALRGEMNGFSLAKRARELQPGVDVILAGTVERAVQEAADLCEDSPLPRPYEPQVVVERIKRLLATRGRRKKN